MSNSINKVTLLGRIGKEPEFRSFDNDSAVVQFSMATSENYKDKSGEWQEITTWHNIVGWNNLSAKVKKITDSGTQVKGMQVLVEGKIKNRSYDDKDGNKKHNNIYLVKRKVAMGLKNKNSKLLKFTRKFQVVG